MISPDDRGFTLGDGLFETVLFDGREMVDWLAHVARLQAGCEALGLPVPEEGRLSAHARQAVYAASLRDVRSAVRISWTAGRGGRGLDRPADLEPTLSVTATAAPVTDKPLRLATAAVRRNEMSPLSFHKTLSYLDNVLARRQAQQAGADEAIMLNTRGELACTAAGNLFWVQGGIIYTPALECGVLAGVIRGRLIELAPSAGINIRTVHAQRSALDEADAVFVSNSLMGVRAVEQVDGRILPQQVEQSIFDDLLGRK